MTPGNEEGQNGSEIKERDSTLWQGAGLTGDLRGGTLSLE